MLRKTKIVCTLGPAVASEEAIRALILGGMDAARFNFSHGTHESHLALFHKLKRVREELGRPVAAILDTNGPEIRIGTFAGGRVVLQPGAEFVLTHEPVEGSAERVSLNCPSLCGTLVPGNRVLLDDGLIELTVKEVRGQEVVCVVDTGGVLSDHKSIHLPGVLLPLPYLNEKDEEDLRFAAEQDFDFIAASFVSGPEDVLALRRVLDEAGGADIRIIAKIENRRGIENLESIIDVADGVMVARGDLGVEISAYEIPVRQKQMISACVAKGKPVITATQMLESMIGSPKATRAEISDVANAVFDGTSCVMLSGETAAGKYPLEALYTMTRAVTAAEEAIDHWDRFRERVFPAGRSVTDAVSYSCCHTAMVLEAAAILTATFSGHTARMVSRFRPACPIAALTLDEKTRRQLAISWGVTPFLSGAADSTDELFSQCVRLALEEGLVFPGQTVVITAGVPIGEKGTTNLIKAQTVGELP